MCKAVFFLSKMSIALSSDDRSVIERSISTETMLIEGQKFEDVFEVEKCVKWIQDNRLENVTLQFPDELLPFSAQVALSIEAQVGKR